MPIAAVSQPNIQVVRTAETNPESNSAVTNSAIDTIEKAKKFIEQSIDIPEKQEEHQAFIEADKLLCDLNLSGNKDATFEQKIELIELMASAHFLEAKSGLEGGKEKSEALQEGIIKILEGEIAKGSAHFDINAPVGYKNLSLLMCGAHYNLPTVSLFLIDQHGIKFDACDDENRTTLTRAVCNNAEDVVKALIKKGADPFKDDIYQQNSAMKAAATGSDLAFAVILAEAENATHLEMKENPSISFNETTLGKMLHAQSKQLWTVVHYAANSGSAKILNMLFGIPGKANEMVNLLKQGEKTGRTPLMVAAANGKAGSIAAIMDFAKDYPAETRDELLNAKDNHDNTPLLDAVRYGHAEAAETLHKYGADSFLGNGYQFEDGTEKNPFNTAMRLYQEEIKVLALTTKYMQSPSGVADCREFNPDDIRKACIDRNLDPKIRNKVMRQVTVKAMAQNKYEQVWNAINA